MHFERLYLSTDRQMFLVNWSSIPPQILDPGQLVYDAPWREHAG
jgi:hypothetical protein